MSNPSSSATPPIAKTLPNKPVFRGKTYDVTSKGTVRWKKEFGEWKAVPLATFSARVIEALEVDDGVEIGHEFKIEATLKGGKITKTFSLPWAQFEQMNWATKFLGIKGIIYPNCRDHLRTAIMVLSKEKISRSVFRHTGWRKIKGQMVYLHGEGAIGPYGAVRGVETKLSHDLSEYVLPDPPKKRAEVAAGFSSLLRMLDVAPDRITVLLLAALCRSLLGEVYFAIFITALKESGKSELCALIQRCFGPKMHAKRLPGRWPSTANSLEQLAFEAKDAIFVIDDFIPKGSQNEVQQWHSKADRVLRAQGNHGGRQRLTADLAVRGSKAPRGLILSNGETVPKGASLQARIVTLPLAPGDLNFDALGPCQKDASSGLYAQATAAFIRWLSPRMERMEQVMEDELAEFRPRFKVAGRGLSRAPDNLFNLAFGFQVFLSFGLSMNAITREQADALWLRAVAAFDDVLGWQDEQQAQSDPCQRFFTLVTSLLSSGRGHIAHVKGGAPPDPGSWGWRPGVDGTWTPQGKKLGWIDKRGVFLLPEETWLSVVELARQCQDHFDMEFLTLQQRLKERGLLASTELDKRGMYCVRKICEGISHSKLLHIFPFSICPPETDKSDKSASDAQVTEAALHRWQAFKPLLLESVKAESPEEIEKEEVIGMSENLSDLSVFAAHIPGGKPNGVPKTRKNEWTRAGFESKEAFDLWFENLYANHPRRGGLQEAQDLLIEKLWDGSFQREAFEAGYCAHKKSPAWLREDGRFIPKLSTFVKDRGWMFPPVEPLATPDHNVSVEHTHKTGAERRSERLRNI